jgi:2-amino-4-hydroxy-6-hydroxymethyldihydropteridine diphosphokinase
LTTAYVALGSNLGDRLGYLRRAVGALRAAGGIEVAGVSSVYETDPVGPPQPEYLNAVVRIETELVPHDLLRALKGIERELGRTPSERWGPREIDLDLLLYGEERLDTDELVVPHPRMAERAFVLVPLGELTGDERADASVRLYAGQDALSP